MIPYFPPWNPEIFGFQVQGWILFIVIGIALGTEFARARAMRENLSVKITVDTTLFMVLNGFLFAHFVHVLAYNWDRFVEEPIILAPWYGGYSSTGGFLGAAIAIPIFLKCKKAPVWAYLDDLAMGFVLGFAFGRVGCFTAHDHKGAKTDFFLGVAFPERWGGPRHDNGLYEALALFAIFGVLVLLDRNKQRFHGFLSAVTLFLYAPARFGLDFLRARDLEEYGLKSDVRYYGLTPAQYGAILLLLLGVWIWWVRKDQGRQDTRREALRDFRPGEAPPELLAALGEAPAEDAEPADAPTA